VFKSRIRWAFFGFGCATFLAGVIYMFTLAWA
jgi:bacteriorhodopsin